MHTLSVSGWEYGEPAAELAKAATRFFRMLAIRQPSLPSLSIFGTQGRPPPSRGCVSYGIPLVPDTFEGSLLDLVHPLLGLSALRDLKLVFPSYFDIACTAVDLRAVAEAFPALETFRPDVWFYGSSSPWQLASERAPVPPERERPRGGPLGALVHFARNRPRLRVLYLPAMEMVESDGPVGVGVGGDAEPHGLRTLVVPMVLLPPGRADLVGEVSEVVRAAFPLVASVFRPERLVMDGDWAVVEGVQSWCPRPRARLSKADKLLRFA